MQGHACTQTQPYTYTPSNNGRTSCFRLLAAVLQSVMGKAEEGEEEEEVEEVRSGDTGVKGEICINFPYISHRRQIAFSA